MPYSYQCCCWRRCVVAAVVAVVAAVVAAVAVGDGIAAVEEEEGYTGFAEVAAAVVDDAEVSL